MNCSADLSYAWINVDRDKCDKCGICVDMCPMDVLRFDCRGYPQMQYRDDCWYCEICSFFCPRQAIKMVDLPYLVR
jgi:NAD-dependent dihydropyrimidine dehydrogenase PreA subunit